MPLKTKLKSFNFLSSFSGESQSWTGQPFGPCLGLTEAHQGRVLALPCFGSVLLRLQQQQAASVSLPLPGFLGWQQQNAAVWGSRLQQLLCFGIPHLAAGAGLNSGPVALGSAPTKAPRGGGIAPLSFPLGLLLQQQPLAAAAAHSAATQQPLSAATQQPFAALLGAPLSANATALGAWLLQASTALHFPRWCSKFLLHHTKKQPWPFGHGSPKYQLWFSLPLTFSNLPHKVLKCKYTC